MLAHTSEQYKLLLERVIHLHSKKMIYVRVSCCYWRQWLQSYSHPLLWALPREWSFCWIFLYLVNFLWDKNTQSGFSQTEILSLNIFCRWIERWWRKCSVSWLMVIWHALPPHASCFPDISSSAAFTSPADLSIWFVCLNYCTCSVLSPSHISYISFVTLWSQMKENVKGVHMWYCSYWNGWSKMLKSVIIWKPVHIIGHVLYWMWVQEWHIMLYETLNVGKDDLSLRIAFTNERFLQ